MAKEIVIPPKSSLSTIAAKLYQEGAIDSPLLFKFSAALTGVSSSLKAGEYLFEPPVSLLQVIRKLFRGDVLLNKVTVVEGKTVRDILDLLKELPKLQGEIQPLPSEGSFLAETYTYTFGESRERLVKNMQKALELFLDEVRRRELSPPAPLKSFEEAIILASLVEKETALPQERPRIAAVFLNRLKAGMRLQCDPTLHYALSRDQGRSWNQALTREDLQYPSPYNTYLHEGLPPTPICIVGKEALLAVLTPAQTRDLYFVADGKGGHVFTSSGIEHQKNHSLWRKMREEQKKKL